MNWPKMEKLQKCVLSLWKLPSSYYVRKLSLSLVLSSTDETLRMWLILLYHSG